MADGRPTILVAPHWRREVADVAETLRASAPDGPPVEIVGGGRFPGAGSLMAHPDAVVLSDGAPLPTRLAGIPVVRLWWNGSDEVLAHLAQGSNDAESHVCFFPDVAAELSAAGVEVVHVPYAFAAPAGNAPGSDLVAGYVGEVSTDGTGLPTISMMTSGQVLAAVIDRAAAVTDGSVTLVEADAGLAEIATDAGEHAALLWGVRNHVRYNLVTAMDAAFGPRLRLRGNDWSDQGFRGEPTRHGRRSRRRGYRRHRVSLDLASKSTHDALYPRSAEIMAMGGGLVQFDTGAPPSVPVPGLVDRQAGSADRLVDVVEHRLTMPAAQSAAENADLRDAYAVVRLASGRRLLDTILARLATSPGSKEGPPA